MKNGIMRDIGTRIRQLRQKNGLTIEETAHLAGVHPNYLGDAERGNKNFSIATLAKLAQALDVPISGIFSGKTAANPPNAAPVDRLVSLFKNASPEGRDFIIQAAQFAVRTKAKAA